MFIVHISVPITYLFQSLCKLVHKFKESCNSIIYITKELTQIIIV